MEADKIFPENWKEVIRGKKVILYNTGVSALLRGRERQIEKIKWVFQIFKEHPEVVLWWRPHPLEFSTLQSMLPELEEQYREARRQYLEEHLGILDESADLNRAIAISDAYYGAWSSVAVLYREAKKPVLYENNRTKARGVGEISLLPAAVCAKSEAVWFIQSDSNKLIKVNRTTHEVEKIVNISYEPPVQHRYYSYHMIDIGTSLLLLFSDSGQIYEYEIETDDIRVHKPQGENFIFRSEAVIEKNGKLLMFPFHDSDVLEFDYRTDTIEKRRMGDKKIKIAKCYEIVGSDVYMADQGSNALYQYDLTKGAATVFHIGEKDNKYWGVKKAGSYFVLPHIDKRVVTLWDGETGEVSELTAFPEGYVCVNRWAYFDMFERAGDIYIFPAYANMILRIDIKSKKIEQAFPGASFTADYDDQSEGYGGQTYIYAAKSQNLVYTFSLYKKCWQIFDLDTMEMQEKASFEIKTQEHKRMLTRLLDDHTFSKSFCEWETMNIYTLENYIQNIQRCDMGSKDRDADRDSIGASIHKLLINTL